MEQNNDKAAHLSDESYKVERIVRTIVRSLFE